MSALAVPSGTVEFVLIDSKLRYKLWRSFFFARLIAANRREGTQKLMCV